MFEELDSSGLGILGEHTKITPLNAINARFHKVDTAEVEPMAEGKPRGISGGLTRILATE